MKRSLDVAAKRFTLNEDDSRKDSCILKKDNEKEGQLKKLALCNLGYAWTPEGEQRLYLELIEKGYPVPDGLNTKTVL